MTKKAKKFAVPLNISVSKEMYDRAQRLQQAWDAISLSKFDKRFRMSDLGDLVWQIGLSVLEELNKGDVMETIAKECINNDMIKVEVRKARKALKTPNSLSQLTDSQIEAMASGKEELTEA